MKEEWQVVQRARGSTLKQLWGRLRTGAWAPSSHFMYDGQIMPPIMGGGPGDTVDKQVAASEGDAYERGDGDYDYTGAYLAVRSYADTGHDYYRCVGAQFTGVTIAQGATIDTAYQEGYLYQASSLDDPNLDIYANDVDDANDFNTEQDVINRTRTSASAPWVEDNLGTQDWYGSSIEIKAVIQEVINRATWVSGNALALLWIARTDADKLYYIRSYDYTGNAHGPKLHIEYTAAAAGVPLQMMHYMRMRR